MIGLLKRALTAVVSVNEFIHGNSWTIMSNPETESTLYSMTVHNSINPDYTKIRNIVSRNSVILLKAVSRVVSISKIAHALVEDQDFIDGLGEILKYPATNIVGFHNTIVHPWAEALRRKEIPENSCVLSVVFKRLRVSEDAVNSLYADQLHKMNMSLRKVIKENPRLLKEYGNWPQVAEYIKIFILNISNSIIRLFLEDVLCETVVEYTVDKIVDSLLGPIEISRDAIIEYQKIEKETVSEEDPIYELAWNATGLFDQGSKEDFDNKYRDLIEKVRIMLGIRKICSALTTNTDEF